MTTLLSLRIDTAIKPTSHVRMLMYGSLATVIILMAWLAGLVLWQYVIILVVATVVIGYLALSKPILLHISQPPLSKRLNSDWHLLMRTARADELWQAQLCSVQHNQQLVHLSFNIVEPYKRSLAFTIYRDQVNSEQWRQLCILANSY